MQDPSELYNPDFYALHKRALSKSWLFLTSYWKGNLWSTRRDILQSQESAVRYGTFPTERLAFPFRGGSRKHSFFTNIFKYLSSSDHIEHQSVLSLRCLSTEPWAWAAKEGACGEVCWTILIAHFHPSYNCKRLIRAKEPHLTNGTFTLEFGVVQKNYS